MKKHCRYVQGFVVKKHVSVLSFCILKTKKHSIPRQLYIFSYEVKNRLTKPYYYRAGYFLEGSKSLAKSFRNKKTQKIRIINDLINFFRAKKQYIFD